ncbi:RNA-binding protein NOB1 [Myotis brandtii]|uniref:RNA-binding protein NOB1 n=1 Tax=Myotis brandtii TaxID=109478 RepID=S7PVU2_MYOBR|nr:RNA-binding protein NOB1 [Myotis brandtii]
MGKQCDLTAFECGIYLNDIGKSIYSTRGVVSELWDKAVCRRLPVLPYVLRFKEPRPEYAGLSLPVLETPFADADRDLQALLADGEDAPRAGEREESGFEGKTLEWRRCGWVTPAPEAALRIGAGAAGSGVGGSCVPTDAATQSELLQMRLPVRAVNGVRIPGAPGAASCAAMTCCSLASDKSRDQFTLWRQDPEDSACGCRDLGALRLHCSCSPQVLSPEASGVTSRSRQGQKCCQPAAT